MYSGTSLIGPSLGPKKFGPIKEVAILMRLESTPELYLGPTRGGHYNEVVLLQRWPLSKVSLYVLNTVWILSIKHKQESSIISNYNMIYSMHIILKKIKKSKTMLVQKIMRNLLIT